MEAKTVKKQNPLRHYAKKPLTITLAKSKKGWTWSYSSKQKLMMVSGEVYQSETAAKNAAKSMIMMLIKQNIDGVAFTVAGKK